MSDKSPVTGIAFGLIYADNMETTLPFYEKYLGFKKEFDMDDGSCWGKAGGADLWIGGGYNKTDLTERSTRASIMLNVESANGLFEILKSDGISVVQDKPIEMKEGVFWFQFSDPTGNILEVLGK